MLPVVGSLLFLQTAGNVKVTNGVRRRQEDRPCVGHTTAVGAHARGTPEGACYCSGFWNYAVTGAPGSTVLVDEAMCVYGVRRTEVCVLGNGLDEVDQ